MSFLRAGIRTHSFFKRTMKLVRLNRQNLHFFESSELHQIIQMSVNPKKYCCYLVQPRKTQVPFHKKISECYLGLN